MVRKLLESEIRKIIQRSRRNYPVELREVRWREARGAAIHILSAPLDTYRLDDVNPGYEFNPNFTFETAVPIDGLWESVLAELRDIQTKKLWPELQHYLHDESESAAFWRGFAKGSLSELMDLKELPEIHVPRPLIEICPTATCCVHCGKPFFYFNRMPYHYCCAACQMHAAPRQAAIATRVAAISEKRAEKRAGTTCGYCGALFDPKRATAKFCSPLCRVKNHYRQHSRV